MKRECYALLDDAHGAGSRLYTQHAATLSCTDLDGWQALLDALQQALQRGQYGVLLCAYELGPHLLRMAPRSSPGALAQVLLFERCEHLTPAAVNQWLAARSTLETIEAAEAAGIAALEADVTPAAFNAALATIRAYLEAGDVYQVNYTYRLRFDAFGAPLALYARLRARQSVPYGALVELADGSAVLSLSPELFVRHRATELTAQPMKGTAPAGPPEEQAARAAALAADPKNRAENLMIVDLLRNDIGRVAVTGSVAVPELFHVQRYGSVLQMTSTVRATLRPDATLRDIFSALYPCGSITGAPKRRSMEIIDELELAPRGIYTGAIGWFDPLAAGSETGDFCLAVPIRTLLLQAPDNGVRRGEMGVGAGIVFDSNAAEEYAECQLKAAFLSGLPNQFQLFETLYASHADGCRQRVPHLARLAASALYFGFTCDLAPAGALLDAACAALPDDGAFRLRLALAQDGKWSLESAPLTPLTPRQKVLLAPHASAADDLFLRHKTTRRARYDAAWREAEAQGAFDALFFNERGELTEGGRSNVFLRLADGHWYTPPLTCGVLPGIMRGALLADPAWDARECVITRAMLHSAQEIVLCNALRGAFTVTLATAP